MNLETLIHWLVTRGMQLGARYLGYLLGLLFVWLKMSPAEDVVLQASGEIMSGVGVILMLIADHYLHGLNKAKLIQKVEARTVETVKAEQAFDAAIPPPPLVPFDGAMIETLPPRPYDGIGDKITMLILSCVLCTGTLGVLSGCATTEAASAVGAAAGTAVGSYLLNHVSGIELTYDSNTGQFGVHTNVRDLKRRERIQRAVDEANTMSEKEKCQLIARIDKAHLEAQIKARDADQQADDKRALKAIEDRRKNCGKAPVVYTPPVTTQPPAVYAPPVTTQPPISLANPPAPIADLVNAGGRNRVVLIGDNFPGTSAELHECVNDVKRDAQGFIKYYGIQPNEIRYLINEQCTAENIKAAIKWAFAEMEPTHHRAVCVSGHGAEDTDPVTGKIIDVIVTYDMVKLNRWDATTEVTPEFWRSVLREIPAGCNAFIKLDVCHAGGMIKPLLSTGRTVRSIDGPGYVQTRLAEATERDSLRDTIAQFNCTFVAACGAGQLSEETSSTGGAATFYWWEAVATNGPETFSGVLTSKTKQALKANAFSQSPEAKGSTVGRPVMK